MSVDYKAYYGIGYKVEAGDIDGDEMDDGLLEYLSDSLSSGFDCFETGNLYSGDQTGVYILIKEPFKNGLDLTQAKISLDNEIERVKVRSVEPFGAIGGLLIW